MRNRVRSRLSRDKAWATALPVGRFEGRFTLQWLAPELFFYIPDPLHTMRYIRANGEIIQPEEMLTDGGSMALLAQLATRMTRWSYGLAFPVHDCLWEQARNGDQSREAFERSNMILAEAMRTMQVAGMINRGHADIVTVYRAVSSPVAWRRWRRVA